MIPSDSVSSVSARFSDRIVSGDATQEEILANIVDDSDELKNMKAGSEPAARVKFYRLRLVREGDAIDGIAIVLPAVELERVNAESAVPHAVNRPVIGVYRLFATRNLYDLSDYARADVLSIGRNTGCDFRPSLDEEETMVDMEVSREHGLIVLRNKQMYYVDYGTDIGQEEAARSHRPLGRNGSRNGTFMNNDRRFKLHKETIEWHENLALNLGHDYGAGRGPMACGFQLKYQYFTPQGKQEAPAEPKPVGGSK